MGIPAEGLLVPYDDDQLRMLYGGSCRFYGSLDKYVLWSDAIDSDKLRIILGKPLIVEQGYLPDTTIRPINGELWSGSHGMTDLSVKQVNISSEYTSSRTVSSYNIDAIDVPSRFEEKDRERYKLIMAKFALCIAKERMLHLSAPPKLGIDEIIGVLSQNEGNVFNGHAPHEKDNMLDLIYLIHNKP